MRPVTRSVDNDRKLIPVSKVQPGGLVKSPRVVGIRKAANDSWIIDRIRRDRQKFKTAAHFNAWFLVIQ